MRPHFGRKNDIVFVVAKRKITVKGLLMLLEDIGELIIPPGTRAEVYKKMHSPMIYRTLDDYFPVSIENTIRRMERKGLVKLEKTIEGTKVFINEKGKQQTLIYKLTDLKPHKGIWDGRWRIILFDISEKDRIKRNELRKYLKLLGLKQMQESVWVTPWEVRDEIKYLREILEIPHAVKWGILDEIENAEDLKRWFGV
jgi:hypothetical protein